MSEFYRISLGCFDGVFAVPTLVADRLRLTDAKALKPLLYLLSRSGARVSVEDISRATGLSTDAVRDGLDFWVGEGLLRRDAGDYLPDASAVQPVGAPSLAADESAPDAPAGARLPGAAQPFSRAPSGQLRFSGEIASPLPEQTGAETPEKNAPHASDGEAAGEPPRSARVSSRPAKLAPGEVASRCEQDTAVRFMLEKSEQLLGRPLNTADLSTLISLVDWAGLSPDLVLMLVSHCRDLGKTNLRYIERVGADWADRGIDTHEKAEALIRRQTEEQEQEREVMTAFGLTARALTAKEKGYVSQWYGAFGYDLRMIRLAYERAVDRTGKLSFPYIHKILQSWHEKGFRDPKDAAGESAPQDAGRGRQEAAPSTMDYDLAEQMLYQTGRQ